MYTTSFMDVSLEELLPRVQTLHHEGMRFVQLCAERGPEDDISLLYSFYDEATDNALNLVVPLPEEARVPSIQDLYIAAFSYENETHDLYGVRFVNMKLDFGGHFFNLAETAPMTIISPEQKAAREKAAKQKAAKEAAAKAKAAKAAKAAREAAEQKAAEKAESQTPAEADAEAVAKVVELGPKPAASAEPAAEAAPEPAPETPAVDERTAKMIAKLATMPPEKAAKLRANLAARGIVVPEPAASAKEGE